MKKITFDKNVKNNIVSLTVSGIILTIFVLIITNISNIFSHVSNFLSVISPFLWGILFAYLGKGLALKIETILPNNWSLKLRRALGSIITILFIILCFVVIIIIILPQLITSISSLAVNITAFFSNPNNYMKYLNYLNLANTNIPNMLGSNIKEIGNFLLTFVQNGTTILNSTKNFLGQVFNFVLGFIIALFFLIERGNIKSGLEFIGKRYLSDKNFKFFKELYTLTVSKLYDYFKGSIIDCVLVGIECFILMSIFRLEYASLISVIVGITNVIPFFGPFIGGIPSFLLLLLVNPTHAVIFGILVILIQQVDGNLIAPKIIGDSVGVPRLWVMFVIIVAGAYFGFFGMIFGVPIFSVIYTYVSMYFNNKKSVSKQ